MSEEHYRALGISPDASKAEIRAAYKQRVKETHPDLNDDPNAAAEFQRVKEARDALLGSGTAGAASGGSGRSGPGSSGAGASGTSSGRSTGRGSSGRGRTETSSGGGADSRDRRSETGSDAGDARTNYSTRTEEPTGEHAGDYGGGSAGSDSRRARGSSTGSGTNRSETASGSSGRQRRPGGGGEGASGGSTDRRRDASADTGGTQDYVRFRSVIEEPSGNRAASYDRVVTDKYAPTRPTAEPESETSEIPLLIPAFLIVLVKQYLYSLKWALLGIPLTVIYLWGIRGLYFGGFQASMLSMLLGAVGVSLVKVRLGVNFAGTATIPLMYYGLIWVESPSLLEVGIAFHLVPLFVVTALISEYK